jgi:nicotinamidase-related amidase
MLDRNRAIVVVIDLQEAFRTAVRGFDACVANAQRLLSAARILDVPVIVTEQYPDGLGATVPELSTDGCLTVNKLQFSAVGIDEFDLGHRDQAVVCGVEAHVCVYQTAMDLLGNGVAVDVCIDAVASRHSVDRDAALRRMQANGALPTTTETVIFELCRTSVDPAFKSLQRLIL